MPPLGPTGWVLKTIDSWYVRRVAGRREVDVRVHLGWRDPPEDVSHDGTGDTETVESTRSYFINVRNNSPRRRVRVIACWIALDPAVSVTSIGPGWVEADGDQWETWIDEADLPSDLTIEQVAPLVRVKLGNDEVLEGRVRTDELPPSSYTPRPTPPTDREAQDDKQAAAITVQSNVPIAGEQVSSDDDVWSLEGPPMHGGWDEIGREHDVTYRWPDGNVDRYAPFVSYRGNGDYLGMTLGLGYLDKGDVTGFVVTGSNRALTYFFPADDFDQSHEVLSMIKGGGKRGRGVVRGFLCIRLGCPAGS